MNMLVEKNVMLGLVWWSCEIFVILQIANFLAFNLGNFKISGFLSLIPR